MAAAVALVDGARPLQEEAMRWRAGLRLVLGAIGLALAAPLVPASPADPLAEALALPLASELVGARDAERFAWVESAAGVRDLWFAARGQAARRLTAFDQDDGDRKSTRLNS